MLRITTKFATDEPCLVLEGRLIGDWVAELEAAVGGQSEPLHLDLSRVRFVDADGLALLHRLRSQGAVFLAVSPFVAALLNTRSL
jgi:ABC-type transporter Mla MlaB component